MSKSDQDTSYVADALPTFISEAQDQIATIEHLLLRLEETPDDRDLLDELFRCAHTVKGSAGIFGLDTLVGFTHHVETLLDGVRGGGVTLTPNLGTLLLQCKDQIQLLLDAAKAAGGDADDADTAPTRAELIVRLHAAGGGGALAGLKKADLPTGGTQAHVQRRWNVSVRFGTDIFRNGMDPLALLCYVSELGTLAELHQAGSVPNLEEIDPESCHLAFTFTLQTEAPRDQIEAAFSFVRDDCELLVEPAESAQSELIALIESLPDQPRLGELLVAVGAITAEQLSLALQRQAEAAAAGNPQRVGALLQKVADIGPQVVDAAVRKQSRQREAAAGKEDNRFIRVQADRLDAVINLLGELVIASAGAQMMARQARMRPLIEANTQVGRLIEEIRNGTLQLRMVPIGETFARFRRVVRDTAADLGKEVALQIVGGETELDKSVVERIADPLMHIVRNALDHGLEKPDVRAAVGKSPQGTLTLLACHEAGNILIRIADDGAGILRRKVLERAWQRGIVESGVTPSDDEILKLIFEPGFSTADTITNLSGRGVGMDVVRRNIEELRGAVTIRSVEGAGSTIEIRLPLTLAIIDGFLVGIGNSMFIVPLEAVVEVNESRHDAVKADSRGRTSVDLRGRLLPIVDLRPLYGLEQSPCSRMSVVVLQSGDHRYGIVVDTLHGQHQTVIKPLSRMFRRLRGVSGSCILGSGEVALILDVNALYQLASSETPAKLAA